MGSLWMGGIPCASASGRPSEHVGHAGALVSLSGGLQEVYFQAEATRSKHDCVPGLSLCRLHGIFTHQLYQLPAHARRVPPAPSTEKAECHVTVKERREFSCLLQSTY